GAVAELDAGAIIGQAVVPVLPGDDHDRLASRGLALEHILYPRCVRAVAAGEVVLAAGGRVAMDDATALGLVVVSDKA
ncbi:MAG: phosphoribosylglycinamide formyltransferase, partial [Duodenibacillus sp.]|nr:phosphoribosylglycinamide formyltransferase [Duodenibacillus sp.]